MWLREVLPVAWERLAEGFGGFGGGQTAGSNALKNRWLGYVAADAIVAVARDERATFHTSGGPRRRPGLSEGRGRRILAPILQNRQPHGS